MIAEKVKLKCRTSKYETSVLVTKRQIISIVSLYIHTHRHTDTNTYKGTQNNLTSSFSGTIKWPLRTFVIVRCWHAHTRLGIDWTLRQPQTNAKLWHSTEIRKKMFPYDWADNHPRRNFNLLMTEVACHSPHPNIALLSCLLLSFVCLCMKIL